MCRKHSDVFRHREVSCGEKNEQVWCKLLPGNLHGGIHNSVYLKVDVPILQPVGTALVEEVDVFDEQAEERDDNLQDNRKRKGIDFTGQVRTGLST